VSIAVLLLQKITTLKYNAYASSCFRLAKLLQKPFREEAIRQTVVFYCSAESRNGMTSVKDVEYSGCLPTGRRYRNVEHIYKFGVKVSVLLSTSWGLRYLRNETLSRR
jgi:hypothetical protein